MRPILLTTHDVRLAEAIGSKRHSSHRHNGSVKGRLGASDIHTIGAIGELAVVRAYNLEWTGRLFTIEDWLNGKRSLKDVEDVDVKATTHPTGRLLVKHETEMLHEPYILARVLGNYVQLAGWAWGDQIARSTDSELPTPCFALPNSRLLPMEELERMKGWVYDYRATENTP